MRMRVSGKESKRAIENQRDQEIKREEKTEEQQSPYELYDSTLEVLNAINAI